MITSIMNFTNFLPTTSFFVEYPKRQFFKIISAFRTTENFRNGMLENVLKILLGRRRRTAVMLKTSRFYMFLK